MLLHRLRLYIDTSVFGGCFDEEFEAASNRLVDAIRTGRYAGIVSEVVLTEVREAPKHVQDRFASIPLESFELLSLSSEAIALREAYLDAGIVGPKWRGDAGHVALATITRADALVSWNFRHLVRLDKIRQFNHINLLQNYGLIQIISPLEVFTDEEEG